MDGIIHPSNNQGLMQSGIYKQENCRLEDAAQLDIKLFGA